jgi:hypothetical protein
MVIGQGLPTFAAINQTIFFRSSRLLVFAFAGLSFASSMFISLVCGLTLDLLHHSSCVFKACYRTWYVKVPCGNEGSAVLTVNVKDNYAPAIACPVNKLYDCTDPIPCKTTAATGVGVTAAASFPLRAASRTT